MGAGAVEEVIDAVDAVDLRPPLPAPPPLLLPVVFSMASLPTAEIVGANDSELEKERMRPHVPRRCALRVVCASLVQRSQAGVFRHC